MDLNAASAPVDRNAATMDPPSVALMLDEEDQMFRNSLLEVQKEYTTFMDSWPSFSDYTKASFEGLKMAIKQKEAETISKIESYLGRSSAGNHQKP